MAGTQSIIKVFFKFTDWKLSTKMWCVKMCFKSVILVIRWWVVKKTALPPVGNSTVYFSLDACV